MSDLTKPRLTAKERAALREFKLVVSKRQCMGRRRIVSMQGLEKAGLVKRVVVNGLIADWQITPAGQEWDVAT
jgi:hypothetical protein